MRTSNLITCCLTAVFLFPALPCVYAEMPPLTVEAAVMTHPKNIREAFLVEARVKNVSNDVRVITVWQCNEKENWISDNEGVYLSDTQCSNERLTRIVLRPGQDYKRRLKYQINFMQDIRRPVVFKIGLVSVEDPDYLGTIRYSKNPVWSHSVEIDYGEGS